jgi:hypothetical protein
MTKHRTCARRFASLLAAATIMGLGIATDRADAAPRATRDDRIGYPDTGRPDRSYRSRPHTHVYVTKRSWLDGGTEVLPGDRKFTDYALPPGRFLCARERQSLA